MSRTDDFYDGYQQALKDVLLMLEKNDPYLLREVIPHVEELAEDVGVSTMLEDEENESM